MKILLISNDAAQDDRFYHAFMTVAEKHELQICRTIAEADCFIAKELILKQKQLDLIITDLFEDETRSARHFCYDIRNDYQSTYSHKNFKLSSIPIVLMFPGRINREQYINFGFDDIIDNSYDWFYDNLIQVAISTVKKWRNIVYDDLELLKLGQKQKFNRTELIIQKSKTEITKILTEDYVLRKKALEISWFQPDYNSLEKGLTLLTKRIKEAEHSTTKKEKKFHNVFNRYNSLLLRGSYSRHFYEPRFPKTSNHAESIPDYILTPYYGENQIEVMEFKTPNEPFYEQTEFHPTLRKKVFKHLGQVKDYKEYLEDPENENELEIQLGLKPITIKYNLVIGRRDDFLSKHSVYQRRARQFNLEEVNIVTFDNLVEWGERYLREMEILGA